MFLTALFRARIASSPHAPAVIAPSGTLTYAELDARANRLAHWLRERGAGPERIVALRMPRSAGIVVAQLAVLKAGAAYLPVDPAYPAERIDFMLRDAAPVLTLESEVDTSGMPDTDPEVAVDPAHPAYVIYTSGSTGRPKGVVVTHTGLANFATAEIEHFQVRPGDRVLQFSSPSFDASVLELCMALPSGAALVVPPEGPLLGEQLAEVLRDNRITHALIPPVAMATVPDVPLPDFRTLIVGGDACTPELVERWAPGRRMINAYGPTESTVVSTWSEPLTPGGPPPIGTPIPGTVAHVLDDDLRPAAEGELYVTGAGLARGYLDRPGLTAQRFIANPFGPGRLYRTGDVVRWREGVLEFVGRADHQVKIRGFRIEPGEIEAVLREHPGVREAVVVARADQGLKRLVAYVTGEADRAELRGLVAARLPEHMVPSAFVVLDAFPLSPNGKLDRSALPMPASHAETPGFTAPRTPAEQRVARAWAEVLGLDAVGAEDDFFQLGGDSVLATRALALLGGGLPLRALFEHRTVAALAEALPDNTPAEIQKVHAGQPVPLSRTQKRLQGREGPDSNTAVGVRLSGSLDLPRLQRALDELVARHDALRTTVHGETQVISPHGSVPLELVDDLTAELVRPFDLRTGPLTRALLTRDQVLVLCQHHIITDGRSVTVLLDELARLYAGEQLPPPRLQYPDFALWQQEQPVPSVDYWRHKLDGLEPLDLRTDRVRPPLRSTAGAVLRRRLGAGLVQRLTALGRAHDATLFMTLTALVKVIMARHSGQRDIALGTVNAGRDRAELSEVTGFFVNTLVLRTWLDPQQSFTAYLDQVRDTVLEAFAHDDVPFDQLVEQLRPDRDPSRTPLVQAVVALQQPLLTRTDFGGLAAEEVDLPRPAARFDLVTEFWPRGDDLALTLEYNTDLFDASTIERMADDLVALCEAVTANPDRDLVEFAGEAEDVARVRGFRVDPAVVEEVLHRIVDDAHVVVHDGRLVGYVTRANPAELKGFLSQVLPDYLIPSAWVVLDEIDRANLPEPPAPRVERAKFVAPRTPVEAVLASVFAEVLGVGRVGVRDGFLELGGDSILAISVVTKARAAGLHLTARDVFEHQTIAELAPRVRSTSRTSAEQGTVTGDVPLTPIQHWFFEHHDGLSRFDQSVVLDFTEDVDANRLTRAVGTVVAHHDALRMRYAFDHGWHQCIEPSGHSQLRAEIVAPRQVRLSAHHLVVDGISWRIIAEDLRAAYRGEPLPPKTTSLREWAHQLVGHARAGGFDDERARWEQLTGGSSKTGTAASQHSVTVRLSEKDTERVLREVPPVYRTQVNDVLLAALGCVLSGWTGSPRVLVALEGHGREELFDGIDLSRTVGWFTSMFPVALDLPDAGWGETLKAVKEQLRAVPRRGIGYGALRYLTDAGLPDVTPEVGFNHLGHFDDSQRDMELHTDQDAPRPHAIDVVSRVEGDQLEVTWFYSTELHDEATITRLADEMLVALRDIAHHCAQPDAGGRTPSDFPLARLDQTACDRIALPHVEDVYPLTPMQAGMVFHSLDGVYLQQTSFVVTADPDELASAWQRVVDRTPVLRSNVVWEGVPEPLQVVHARVPVPIRHLDWTRGDREELLRALLDSDRAEGMDLATAPLMRLTLARLPEGEVQVLWTFHHVLLDGWSVFQVLADVLGDPAGSTVRPPFRDYVEWLHRQDGEAAERHWREVLGDFTEPTPLPFDRTPSGQHDSSTTANLRISLSAEESSALYAFAREQRLTPGTVVQGAWAVLLARYGGRDDVCFGATVSGRPADLPGVDDITGIFINTLPVRVAVDDHRPVAAWLRDLQEAQVEARRFEHVPLTDLHAWSGVEGGVNLFDSVLVFENYPADGLPLRDLRAVETTNFPLSATVYPDSELTVLLGYDPAVFDESTARRLGDHLRALLAGIAEDADRQVGALPVLSAAERHRVLVEWNDTAHEVPACTLLDLLAPHDEEAVRFEGEAITAAELERRANRLAHRLIAEGAGPERVVAVSLPRSIDLVVTLLAVLKAGAAYLPIDTELPAERIAFMLGDADPVLVVDSPLDAAGYPTTAPEIALTPDHPAYVIYTSGSTGKPKAVVVPHRGVVNRLLWTQHEYGLTPDDRVLQKTPASFDVSVWEFFWPLIAGAALVVAKPEGHRDPAYLADLIQRESITTVHFVPSMLRAFLREPAAAGCTGLRRVLCSGEALPPDLVRTWYEVLDVPLHNLYGPTEASVDVTSWATRRDADVVPIGKPVWNTALRVLDHELRPVPAGVPGELYLAGVQLARGYLNRPGLTASRFVADPFGPAGTRMYRTGDLARWRADGSVEYLGRTDHQVKIRGLRVELGEIESVLGDAVVVVRDERLVAYVRTPDVDALRKAAEAALPDYMVPSAIVRLDEFPLSPNGKLDRRALPDPEWTPVEHVPPRTPVEEAVAAIWAQALGVDRVGAEDDFFALGGDSIRGMHVTSLLRDAFGVAVSPRDVLSARTVAALADLVEELVLRELEHTATLDEL